MKKRIIMLLFFTMVFVMTGCGGNQSSDGSANIDYKNVDVDLTKLSSTMVYSEVFNMMEEPGDYKGKTVKMKGKFAVYEAEDSDKKYYACVIKDATACCSQGLEFELTDEYKYPDDYPKENEDICVVGVFDTYREGEETYCTLKYSKLI